MEHDMETNNYWVYVPLYVNKQLLGVCNMRCKQTIIGCMEHDMKTNNYWVYGA